MLSYDAENRLTGMTGAVAETHVYDRDGVRVRAVITTPVSIASIYIGNYFEITGGITRTYYYAGNVRVAERYSTTLYYLLGDHLGSTAVTTSDTGVRVTELRYMPYGDMRYNPGSQITTFRFTGQRWDSGTGLYFYNSRWYDPLIGRFIQADTIIPGAGNPQSLNRYSYVRNNPLRFVDPSGMAECAAGDQQCWVNEWEWKNRWYRAHGYDSNGNRINPEFKDEGIANDVAAELGVYFVGMWTTLAQKSQVLAGAVYLANAMGGADKFRLAFPVGVVMAHLGEFLPGISPGAAWVQPPIANWIFFISAAFGPDSHPMIATVHELAHCWAASSSVAEGFLKAVAGQIAPTWYASTSPDEWFAESVTVAVFGSQYTGPLHNASLYPKEVDFLKGLSGPYVDYLSQYLAVSPSAILR